MEVPAEAAQLSQAPPDLNHPAGEESPLEGHPRYRAVQDLSKCVPRQPWPLLRPLAHLFACLVCVAHVGPFLASGLHHMTVKVTFSCRAVLKDIFLR